MDPDDAAFQHWIGRTHEVEDVVTPRLVDGFRATLPAGLVGPGDVPPGLHWCLCPDALAASRLGPDGHPARGEVLPPIPLPRRMWAGSEVRFLSPLGVGDTVRRRTTVERVAFKRGRTGGLCFVTVRHAFTTPVGLAVEESQTIVYREAASLPAIVASRPEPRTDADHRAEADIGPVMMFRYSALTFNGHRIHYDEPYATGVEGHTGLVIHGPLQATLLLGLCAGVLGRAPGSFAFRAVAPATGAQRMTLLAWREPEGVLSAEARDRDGRTTLVVTARP